MLGNLREGSRAVPNRPTGQVILNREAIMAILPHRPPMLFVDEVIETKEGLRAVFWTDPAAFYFQGHYPDNPIFPLSLLEETMAQGGAVLAILQKVEWQGKKIKLFSCGNKSRVRGGFVEPRQYVLIELVSCTIKTLGGVTTAFVTVNAWVDGQVVAELTASATVVVSDEIVAEPVPVPA